MTANPRIVAFAWAMVGVIVAVSVAVVATDSPTYDVPPSVVQRPKSQPGTPVPQPNERPAEQKQTVGVRRTAAAGKYELWQMPPGPICFQHNGWTSLRVPEIVRAWSAAGVPVTSAATCSGYPIRRRVQFRTYVNDTQTECAKTGSATYSWTYAYGRWTWLPDAMTVWVNQAKWVKTRCYATTAMITHVISHETGHALGVAHNTDPSVMGAWSHVWPTTLDIERAKARYGR